MHALARTESPSPGPQAPPLRVVDVPDARTGGRLSAWDVARYATGLAIGFGLAAIASAPGGTAMVGLQLACAGVAAAVAGLATLRHRACTRRSTRRARFG